MQTNKILGLVFQIERLVKKYSLEQNLEISNSFINISDFNNGKCECIGKQIECKFYFKDLQPKAAGLISKCED